MKIAFLGGGNLASALIGGLVAKGYDPRSISVVEISPAARERLAAKFGVRVGTAPDAATAGCDTLVLAVKPQDMRSALASFPENLKRKLVISVAAFVWIFRVVDGWTTPMAEQLLGRHIPGLGIVSTAAGIVLVNLPGK